jgi:hypothetical protein
MCAFAATPTILGVQLQPDALVLRIDRDLFTPQLTATDAVRIVTFEGANLGEAPSKEWIGRHVEFEDFREKTAIEVRLYIDYAADYVAFQCSELTESAETYSPADLEAKVTALVRVASTYSESWEETSRGLRELRDLMAGELDRAIDKEQRKAAFFAKSRPERAETLKAHLRLLRGLRSKLGSVS